MGIFCVLFVSIASCVSGALVYLLFRVCISFQSLDGSVRKLSSCRVSFQVVCCCCLISSSISLLSVCMRSRVSGVRVSRRSWFRSCIFPLIWELKVGL